MASSAVCRPRPGKSRATGWWLHSGELKKGLVEGIKRQLGLK